MDEGIRNRMSEYLSEEFAAGATYVTVRNVSKALKIKQTEVIDNLPEGVRDEASNSGTLAETRLVQSTEEEVQGHEETPWDYPDPETDEDDDDEIEDEEEEEEDEESDDDSPESKVEGPKVICIICGNSIRTSTEDQREVCPRCWAELVRHSGHSTKALMDMSHEDFVAVVTAEKDRRQYLVDYKASRVLSKEDFEAMKDILIPVKEVFAAGRERKIGPGRIAQAVGGDRFRHEPMGGFGSVWTPFFYGARKGWYFDKDILNHLDELVKLPKIPKEKKAGTNGKSAGRKGARGKAMTVVATTSETV